MASVGTKNTVLCSTWPSAGKMVPLSPAYKEALLVQIYSVWTHGLLRTNRNSSAAQLHLHWSGPSLLGSSQLARIWMEGG